MHLQQLHQLQDNPNPNYNSVLVQYHKLTPVLSLSLSSLLDLSQDNLVDLNHHKETEELYLLLLSEMDYHSNSKVNLDRNSKVNLDRNSKVNLDQHFNNHFNKGQVYLLDLMLLHQDLDNLKQDHPQVLQSDHHNKDFNRGPSSLEQLSPQDFKPDLVHLQQVFPYLIQQLSEVHVSKYCEKSLKHTQGTLKRLLYSFYYYMYALRLWMCINENMLLVLLAIILLMLSKTHQTSCKPTPYHPFQSNKQYLNLNLIVPNPYPSLTSK